MTDIILILKGFILGIANVIPGVSGGTIAVVLGIYERIIDLLSDFRNKIKENIKFLFLIIIGLVISILLFSNIIGYLLNKYTFATILFFIGFIVGGMPSLFKNVKTKKSIKDYAVFFIAFLIVMLMTFIVPNTSDKSLEILNLSTGIILFILGVIGAASMILPGISGSFVLMLFGYYNTIINSIRDLTRFNNVIHNIIILGIFGIGVLLGIVSMSKLIKKLLNKYEVTMYMGIIGFVISSSISIFITALSSSFGVLELVIGIFVFIIGMYLSNKLSKVS